MFSSAPAETKNAYATTMMLDIALKHFIQYGMSKLVPLISAAVVQ